jgi:hypothetical protein
MTFGEAREQADAAQREHRQRGLERERDDDQAQAQPGREP